MKAPAFDANSFEVGMAVLVRGLIRAVEPANEDDCAMAWALLEDVQPAALDALTACSRALGHRGRHAAAVANLIVETWSRQPNRP